MHSESSAASGKHQSSSASKQQGSSARTIKFANRTEIADSEAEESDFEILTQPSWDFSLSGTVISSPVAKATPRGVRFRDTPGFEPVRSGESAKQGGHGRRESKESIDSMSITGLETQWQGANLLPESLLLDELSLPPILDDDEVWDQV